MKVFWFYELPSAVVGRDKSGVFQGCEGPDAEKIVRQVTGPDDGKPFKLVDAESFEALKLRLEAAERLLDDVRSCYTRDDDLPDNILPRIDEWLGGQQ